MIDYLKPYELSIFVTGILGLIFILQLVVADMAGIAAKHTPGFPVTPDHKSFFFRATRAASNSNESVAIFILLLVFGIFSGALAKWLNISVSIYLFGRIVHMLCYYFDLKLARSAGFGVALIGLLGMFVSGICSWFQ